ncbi:aminotransferase class I/II-fold pyridoxal phosphate-dependent enzyme [Parablautia muri]|uniref:Amino acid decarboxylase n=1 Tax=Parablautia muri TaxID=2320879 RepID=A0A9X5BJT9_9FIRM|nr:amino acid decarboxylase [Parablautia muri]NBJ95046.1 amino acid decarboxylase [Parablautia muri]
MSLFDYISDYTNSDYYPFHMPGHKRNPESGLPESVYQYDITEIEGFDNLHQPETIIKDAAQRAARLYDSEETYFLVNGSTSGILSAISAVAERVGKMGEENDGRKREDWHVRKRLIIARNCHKAVYHAAFINRMDLYYVYPGIYEGFDLARPINAKDIESTIKKVIEEAKADAAMAGELIAGVVITSPTYDGIISDIKSIAELLHGNGIPLIVDQAHGAHFGIHPAYPETAVREGADLVIHSVHKTLPSPTQTALLHKNGTLVDSESVRKYLRIYQSSSPSYILMAGIDRAIQVAEQAGYQCLDRILDMRKAFLKQMEKCHYIRVCPFTEPGKLVISVKGSSITGQVLYHILLEKYHLQMEMAAGSYVIAVLSMMDREEGFKRLSSALLEIDEGLTGELGEFKDENLFSYFHTIPRVKLGIWEAYTSSSIEIELDEADGKTLADFIHLYPPGIPLLVPGEMIDRQMIAIVKHYLKNGYTVHGTQGNKIKVLRS